ncbi:hypothetical protein BpHYR1_017327 [Brachionus plicatilis]|uniref:Uncharacterized protein n=1 Tax=Brachionus plicatilis TaxID=10195 RepID=A0A3M7Q0E7_BRAPC|nr:hypothetical protein BpHYR1_017327 [Brachionus plicatilis]
MPLAALKVIGVVRWRYLDSARAKTSIHHLVSNYGNFALHKWMSDILADQMFVPVIAWMHTDGRVAEHGLGTGRGHHYFLSSLHIAFFRLDHAPGMASMVRPLSAVLSTSMSEIAELSAHDQFTKRLLRTALTDTSSMVNLALSQSHDEPMRFN